MKLIDSLGKHEMARCQPWSLQSWSGPSEGSAALGDPTSTPMRALGASVRSQTEPPRRISVDGKYVSPAPDANDNPQMSYIDWPEGYHKVAQALVYSPLAPMSFFATGGDSRVSLRWSAPADDGGSIITNYRIHRGLASGSKALLTTVGNTLAYADITVTNDQGYYYEVSAVTASGEGPSSNEA